MSNHDETTKHKHFIPEDMSQFVTRKGDAKEEAFFEEFYDTHNFDLLLDGSWLRRRNESEWVLKCKGDVQYRIEDIMVTLQKKFNSTGKSPDEICPNLYANFTTERYTFQEGSLWFDVSCFGEDLFYIVGTLESVESKENAGLSMHRASKIIAFITC